MEGRKESNKPENEIRIGFNSRVRNTVNYASILLKENKFRSLNLSAIGGAIGSLVNAVEVLKINNPGLYQVNKIGTVSYQTVDQQGGVQNQRLYPKLEVVLSLDAPKEQGEGYQDKLSEDERTKLQALSQQERPPRTEEDREFAPRGRGGFRGGRGGPRGEFRGGRGGPRGGFRGGFRGGDREFVPRGRGGFRGGRGGFRDEFSGEFRGGRGFSRGFSRGGPRGRGGFRGPRINRGRGF